ncbi:MAG: preprotein translocase subunit SecG [Oscillospiraceae bacterium]|nr:preprotein translocase subunit SecG [Oscillospiraceae bacterium]
MNTLSLILTILQIVSAVVLIVIVSVQSGKSAGLGAAISGTSQSYLSKNKSASFDAKLSKATKWVAAAFILLTFSISLAAL